MDGGDINIPFDFLNSVGITYDGNADPLYLLRILEHIIRKMMKNIDKVPPRFELGSQDSES